VSNIQRKLDEYDELHELSESLNKKPLSAEEIAIAKAQTEANQIAAIMEKSNLSINEVLAILALDDIKDQIRREAILDKYKTDTESIEYRK